MGTRSADRYAAAYEDLKDEASARRFLGKRYEPKDVDHWVSRLRQELFPAVATAESPSPEGQDAIKAILDARKALRRAKFREEERIRTKLLGELEVAGKRAVAQARTLQTAVTALQPLFMRAEAALYPRPPDLVGGPRTGESAEVAVKKLAVRRLLRGLPFVIAEGATPPLLEALAKFIEAFTHVLPQKKQPERKRDSIELMALMSFVAAQPSITGKSLAALICLASKRYPRTPIQAAQQCKRWDTKLTRIRPAAQHYREAAGLD